MDDIFQTVDGKSIKLQPMQGELDRITALRADPRFTIPIPTYSRMSLAGLQTFPHNETTLDDPEGNEEKTKANHAAWDEYKQKQARADNEYAQVILRSIIINGIAQASPEEIAAWIHKQEFIGKPVPVDPIERHFDWAMSEVIRGPKDAGRLIVQVMDISGLPEEMVRLAEESFLGPVGESRRNETSRPENGADGESMVLLGTVRDDSGGNTNGHHPKRVRRVKRRG